MSVWDRLLGSAPTVEGLHLNGAAVKSALATPTPVSKLPARKAGKATSYSAKGAQVAPPNLSEGGSSAATPIRELVPELTSPATRRQVYGQMMTDAGVDVSLRAIKTPVIGAEFYVDSYSDDPDDTLIADFICDNLIGGMNTPLISVLEDIVAFFEDGKAVLEKVYELRPWAPDAPGANSKNYTMLKKLGVRPESTIKTVLYDDNGGVANIIQTAIKADNSTQDVTLPVGKVLTFTFNRKGGRIDGRSILRTAYSHWYYKTHLYKIDAIQKERHSLGIPKGKLLPGWNAQDAAILRTMLRNIRTNEEAFMLLTPNVDVEFAKVEGNLVDVLSSAEHHNFMIMMNVMAQFLVATQGSSAGRATSATQVDIFMKATKYIANYICDVFNMFLIPELVAWNFPTTNFPKLCVKNIGETADLRALASSYANLFAQGALTSDLPTENALRKTFDLPAKQLDAPQTVEIVPPAAEPTNDATPQKGDIKPGAVKPGNTGKSPTGGS